MGYYIDLKQICIDDYKQILKSANLIPSWMVLKENIEENLEIIKKEGIQNLAELKQALKSKDKLQEFSEHSGLPEDYLNVLRRVINGYHPKPNKIKDFPKTTKTTAGKLEKNGIKNSLQLFDKIKTAKSRSQLSEEMGIKEEEVLRLAILTDLSRIRWVNHTFAYVLYEAGYRSVEKIAKTNAQELYKNIKQLNSKTNFYKAHIGLNDMKMVIEAAKNLTLDIEY